MLSKIGTTLIIIGLVSIVTLVIFVSIYHNEGQNLATGNQYFIIQENNSKIKFPKEPIRSVQSVPAEGGNINRYVLYSAEDAGSIYSVAVAQSADTDVNENVPNFSVSDYLEKNFQTTFSSDRSNILIAKERIIFNGKSALKVTLSNNNGYYHMVDFLDGNLSFTLVVGAPQSSPKKADAFFNSFTLQ